MDVSFNTAGELVACCARIWWHRRGYTNRHLEGALIRLALETLIVSIETWTTLATTRHSSRQLSLPKITSLGWVDMVDRVLEIAGDSSFSLELRIRHLAWMSRLQVLPLPCNEDTSVKGYYFGEEVCAILDRCCNSPVIDTIKIAVTSVGSTFWIEARPDRDFSLCDEIITVWFRTIVHAHRGDFYDVAVACIRTDLLSDLAVWSIHRHKACDRPLNRGVLILIS